MLKCYLFREHEFYLWKFVKFLRREENSNNYIIKSWYRLRKNILGKKLGLTIPTGVFGGIYIYGIMGI